MLVLVAVWGCNYNDFSDSDFAPQVVVPIANEKIAALVAGCDDEPKMISREVVVAGRVIANDRSGNFYRTIIIDDGTAAVALKLNFYDLHNVYRLGQQVVVDCCGLALGREQGVVTLGSGIDPWSAYRVDGFALRSQADRHIFRLADVAEPLPMIAEVGLLDESLCGRLVRINNLRLSPHTPAGVSWAESAEDNPYSSVTARYFYTSYGDSIAVVTSAYADFAPNVIPAEPLSLTAIVQRGASGTSPNVYSLKLRDSLDYAPF